MPELSDYEQEYETFWKEIVENPDGTLNLDQVKRELFDFAMMQREVAIAYDNVAGISKPNTLAVHVIEAVDGRIGAAADEAVNDLIESLEDGPDCEFASVAEVVTLIRDLTGVEAPESR